MSTPLPRDRRSDMPDQGNLDDNASAGAPASWAGTPSGALASRFQQMFRSFPRRDRPRPPVRRNPAVPGGRVQPSGRASLSDVRDPLRPRRDRSQGCARQAMPMASVAEQLGAPLEEMTGVVPGEVMAELHPEGRTRACSTPGRRRRGGDRRPARRCETAGRRPSSASASCARSSSAAWR
jgi:hypothetical protein